MGNDVYNGYGWRLTVERASLPDGRSKEGLRVHREDSVHIIAEPRPGSILLLREFRPFMQKYVWMLPGGKADKETDLLDAAQRELREETGYRSAHWTKLIACFYSEAFSFRHHVYHATHLSLDPLPQDENELIEVHEMSLKEAIDRVTEADPVHALSGFALLRFSSLDIHK